MKNSWGLWRERLIGAFKYLMGVSMMVSGVQTAFFLEPVQASALGWLYESRLAMVCFGVLFFVCGATLFLGKILRKRKWVGRGLMSIFCCYTFATVLQFIVYAGDPSQWVINAVLAVVMGLLYLRWRFKTAYINPDHFIDDAQGLRTFEHN